MAFNTTSAHPVAIGGPSKYLTILEEAWQAHLKPRTENAPTVVSLFAGGGGSSLGYSMAGFRELLAVEWDDNAVETFKLNFPDVPVYHGDIAKLSVERVLEMTGLKSGELDILDGSPPCQGLSTAGKRIMDDPRNSLFREYVRLLRGLMPKVLVMENVSGMVKGKMKLIFVDILRELKASGYKVSARLMNTMYFNVPQSRQRIIFIGVRDDLGIEPSHPKAEGKPWAVDSLIGLRATRSQKINPWIDGRLPAATICKTAAGYQVLRLGDRNIETLTIDEVKIICSYPRGMAFMGNALAQWARIGNSVPPLFMRAIAKHIRATVIDVEDNRNHGV